MASRIVVFANLAYRDVVNNWLAAAGRCSVAGVTIVALDAELHRELRARGVATLLRPCEPRLRALWLHRISVLREFLDAGHDVIHADADAVFLRNPMPYLAQFDQDIIFSQGTIWPPDVHAQYGFVVCCGFFALRNTLPSRRFLAQLELRVRLDGDDQRSCNRLLLENGTRWSRAVHPYRLTFRGRDVVCDTRMRFGEAGSLRLGLLPHALFQRICEERDEVYLRHPVSGKTGEDTMQTLARHGCVFT